MNLLQNDLNNNAEYPWASNYGNFVNEIGEIVHGIVDRYSGAANKNIGDAFLLVWKFDEDSMITDEETDEIFL